MDSLAVKVNKESLATSRENAAKTDLTDLTESPVWMVQTVKMAVLGLRENPVIKVKLVLKEILASQEKLVDLVHQEITVKKDSLVNPDLMETPADLEGTVCLVQQENQERLEKRENPDLMEQRENPVPQVLLEKMVRREPLVNLAPSLAKKEIRVPLDHKDLLVRRVSQELMVYPEHQRQCLSSEKRERLVVRENQENHHLVLRVRRVLKEIPV